MTEVFGSTRTGLFLPGSDIDLVCLKTDEEQRRSKSATDEEDTGVKQLSPMKVFADALLLSWGEDLVYLEVLEVRYLLLRDFSDPFPSPL